MSYFIEKIIDAVLEVVMPKVVDIHNQSHQSSWHGFVLDATWNPGDGTVSVVRADTVFAVPPDMPIICQGVKLAVPHTGEQYGPLPDDRVIVCRTHAGWIAYPHHDPFDSIGAPVGEKWSFHRNPITRNVDLQIKVTNDGSVVGSGTGGQIETGGSYFQRVTAAGNSDVFDDAAATKGITRQSSSGHKMTMSDIAGALEILIESQGGLSHLLNDQLKQIIHTAGAVQTIYDGLGNTLAHIVPVGGTVGIGALVSALGSTNAAINNSHITAFESSLHTQRFTDMGTYSTALSLALAGASPPVTISAATIVALIASLAHISVPAGSATVFLKN